MPPQPPPLPPLPSGSRQSLPVFSLMTEGLVLLQAHSRLLLTVTLPAALMLLGSMAADVLGASEFIQQIFFYLGLWLGTGATVQQVRLGALGPAGLTDPKNDPFRVGRREVQTFLIMLAAAGIPMLFARLAAGQAAEGGSPAMALLMLMMVPVLLVLGVRLLVIMATCACDVPSPIRTGWQAGAGNNARLVGIAIAVSIGFLIGLVVLTALAAGLSANDAAGDRPPVEALLVHGLIILWQLIATTYINVVWGTALRHLLNGRPHTVDTLA